MQHIHVPVERVVRASVLTEAEDLRLNITRRARHFQLLWSMNNDDHFASNGSSAALTLVSIKINNELFNSLKVLHLVLNFVICPLVCLLLSC